MDGSSGMAGLKVYQNEVWGLVQSTVKNYTDQEQSPLVVVSLEKSPQMWFGSRLWLPPRSRRICLTPIYPSNLPSDAQTFKLWTRLIDDSGPQERSFYPSGLEGLLRVADESYQTAVISDVQDDAPRNASVALRAVEGLPPRTLYLSDQSMPSTAAQWRGIDGLVISQERPDCTPHQLQALRQWILTGGRVWVMLDQVQPDWLRQLLGDDWRISVLDRVWLNELTIRRESDGTEHPLRFDYPIQMVRVVVPEAGAASSEDVEVFHTVQGYPASIRMRVGEGQVLVTTLYASAWLDPADAKAPAAPLRDLGWFVQRSAGDQQQMASQEEGLTDLAADLVGYRIMSRQPVLAVLVLFTLGLLVSGLLLARSNRLELIAVIGLALAVVASVALLGMGQMHQSGKLPTLASARLVQPVAGHPYARISSLSVIYSPELRREVTLRGDVSELAWPADAVRRQEPLRMVWSDTEHWAYTTLRLPADAVQLMPAEGLARLSEPLLATLRFTQTGMEGRIAGETVGPLEDGLLLAPSGRLAVRFTGSGTFSTDAGANLEADQFIGASVLTQTQILRQQAYRRLLQDRKRPDQATLLAWAPQWPSDMDLEVENLQQPSQTLIELPIRVEPPAPGTRVTVPAALMRTSLFREAGSGYAATIFNERTGEWVYPITNEQAVLLHFTPPTGLEPLQVESARLTMHLRAPGRKYEVIVYRQGRVESVHEGQNPLGALSIDLAGEDAPATLADGGVAVGVRVGPTQNQQPIPWSLTQMSLDVTGTMGPQP